jgi:hypothetical protein
VTFEHLDAPAHDPGDLERRHVRMQALEANVERRS